MSSRGPKGSRETKLACWGFQDTPSRVSWDPPGPPWGDQTTPRRSQNNPKSTQMEAEWSDKRGLTTETLPNRFPSDFEAVPGRSDPRFYRQGHRLVRVGHFSHGRLMGPEIHRKRSPGWSWGSLGGSWGHLGRPWGHLGATFGGRGVFRGKAVGGRGVFRGKASRGADEVCEGPYRNFLIDIYIYIYIIFGHIILYSIESSKTVV